MSSSQPRLYILFRGILNDAEEREEEDEEYNIGEVDAVAQAQEDEVNRLQPNRDPKFEVESLDDYGNLELIFNFLTSWMDRDSDIMDYIDDVQGIVESGMNMLITEKETLGYRH